MITFFVCLAAWRPSSFFLLHLLKNNNVLLVLLIALCRLYQPKTVCFLSPNLSPRKEVSVANFGCHLQTVLTTTTDRQTLRQNKTKYFLFILDTGDCVIVIIFNHCVLSEDSVSTSAVLIVSFFTESPSLICPFPRPLCQMVCELCLSVT